MSKQRCITGWAVGPCQGRLGVAGAAGTSAAAASGRHRRLAHRVGADRTFAAAAAFGRHRRPAHRARADRTSAAGAASRQPIESCRRRPAASSRKQW